MPDNFRVAAFNVENLFARPKVFNLRDKSVGDAILARIGEFRKILKKTAYTPQDKQKLFKEFMDEGEGDDAPLSDYIRLREDKGKFWKRRSRKIVGVRANGSGDCDLTVEFKRAKFSEVGRGNTGKVIRAVKADVACIVEADNRILLKKFDTDVLRSTYRYEMLLDGNDQRGIDVGLYSRYPLGGIWTHMFDGSNRSKTFSRDCPEYEVKLPNGKSLFVLCNHLKSKGYGDRDKSDARRKRQAEAVAEILGRYDLAKDWVVVAGDLNDTPDSAPLRPLISLPNLFDVLALQFPDNPAWRWTYHFRGFQQIDYLLVSKPLKDRFNKAGVERRGMYNLAKLTEGDPSVQDERQYPTVSHWTNAASDHGAVWADFSFERGQ